MHVKYKNAQQNGQKIIFLFRLIVPKKSEY